MQKNSKKKQKKKKKKKRYSCRFFFQPFRCRDEQRADANDDDAALGERERERESRDKK